MLEPVNDVSAFVGSYAAVYALVGDVLLCQMRLYGVDAGAEQREDDDLAICLIQYFFQHAKPWASIELDNLFIVWYNTASFSTIASS